MEGIAEGQHAFEGAPASYKFLRIWASLISFSREL